MELKAGQHRKFSPEIPKAWLARWIYFPLDVFIIFVFPVGSTPMARNFSCAKRRFIKVIFSYFVLDYFELTCYDRKCVHVSFHCQWFCVDFMVILYRFCESISSMNYRSIVIMTTWNKIIQTSLFANKFIHRLFSGRYELVNIDPIESELICRMIQPKSTERISVYGVLKGNGLICSTSQLVLFHENENVCVIVDPDSYTSQ